MSLPKRPALFVAALTAALSCSPFLPARAHAQLEVGLRALESADFQRAIRAFDRAERTETLDRDQLVSLYEGRVIARFALGARTRARSDLAILAALDPEHRFPVEAPPEVAEALAAAVEEAGGGLAAELSWSDPDERSTQLRVEVQRDPASLVRAVRVHARAGAGPWSVSMGPEVQIAHARGEAVAVWVELLGERDVVLLSTASRERPVLHGELAPPAALTEAETITRVPAPASSTSGDDTGLVVGLVVGGAAALLAVGVIVGVVVGTQQTSTDTQPMAPFVVGF